MIKVNDLDELVEICAKLTGQGAAYSASYNSNAGWWEIKVTGV
jgi:hypothetical protein